MKISETFVNADTDTVFGESGLYEPVTEDVGRLFRLSQNEWGRCISSIYVDTDAAPRKVGWVFQSRQRYEDTGEPYLREVWVQLHH